jgi:predicted nucleic acid-binding Zn ribbon protein
MDRLCLVCGEPIPPGKKATARYCSKKCNDRSRLKPKRKKACAVCGAKFYGRKSAKFCSQSCRSIVMSERHRRRKGKPLDKQERECDVCGRPFVTTRWHQLRCSPECKKYVANAKQIVAKKKQRGTYRPHDPYTDPCPVTPRLIALRAAAIRERWGDRRWDIISPK